MEKLEQMGRAGADHVAKHHDAVREGSKHFSSFVLVQDRKVREPGERCPCQSF